MFIQKRWLESSTGATLAFHHMEAGTQDRGILLVCHGLAEHARRYERFATEMAARGYHVYAHDHRGHGETVAPNAPIGRFARHDGVDMVIKDTIAIRDLAASRHPGLPIILFGHSMGGLISLNTAVTAPRSFDATAVWNANFNPGIVGRAAQAILLAERMLKGSDVPSGLLPRLTFGAWGQSITDRRTEFDWLSRDPAEVDKYIDDPLCGFDCSVSLWLDVFALTFRAPQTKHLASLPRHMPFHIVGGGQDPATDNGKAVLWLSNHLKKRGFSHITTEIYQDMRHETLNEISAETAISQFADWCDQITTRS